MTTCFPICFFNNFDYKLAGYSFDLCLTDLTKVEETKEPLERLSKSLIRALRDKESGARDIIRLAHLDCQSFSNEDYADIYDFCFCLQDRWPWKERGEDQSRRINALVDVFDACGEVMASLRAGYGKNDDQNVERLVVRSSYAGPAFQYSHGLSIFFPWTEPVVSRFWRQEYGGSLLSKQTSWGRFLRAYFNLTRRETREEEHRRKDFRQVTNDFDSSLSGRVLELLDDLTARQTAGDQLSKPGPDSPMGKFGPDDPTGTKSCDCPTIKNYPRFTKADRVKSGLLFRRSAGRNGNGHQP